MSDLIAYSGSITVDTEVISRCYSEAPECTRLGSVNVMGWRCASAASKHSRLLSAGTLFYRGAFGNHAAEALLADLESEEVDFEALAGAYVIVWGNERGVRLFTDPVGHLPAYHTENGLAWSTSFLALARAVRGSGINRQAMYEYVFQGTSYDSETPLQGICRVRPHGMHHLTGGGFDPGSDATFAADPPCSDLQDEAVQVSLSRLRRSFELLHRHFDGRVSTALSGGFDSRLVLALLNDMGCRADVYVYGHASDTDVKVARGIADGEGIDLEHIDKSTFKSRQPIESIVEDNFYLFDGLPIDGIYDNGADAWSRKSRMTEGRILLNGGGGEIFRNFFYLPDGPKTASQMVDVFYSQLDPAVCQPGSFNWTDYRHNLARKILTNVRPDGVGERLSRVDVEKVYSLFRLRYWASKNVGINNRIGYSTTPLVEPATVRNALSIPLYRKHWGAHEAAMIESLSSRLASYASAYGRPLDTSPGIMERAKLFASIHKPVLLRRNSFRLRHRMAVGKPLADWESRFARPLNLRCEVVRRYFVPERFRDPAQFRRLMTLEYLLQRVL